MKFSRTVLSLAVVCFVVGLTFSASFSAFGSASAQTVSFVIPFTFSQFIPCANQGNGETVDFSGRLHEVISSTVNANNVHVNQLFNPQGAKGIGETTGDVWEATGETRQDMTASVVSFPFETTFVNNFRLINGSAGSFIAHETFHVTVNADGTTTAFHDNLSMTCK